MSEQLLTAKHSLFQVVLGGLSKVAFLLTTILLYKAVSIAEAGVFSLAYAVCFVLAVISEAGLRGLVIREFARADAGTADAQQLLNQTVIARGVTVLPYFLLGIASGCLLLPVGHVKFGLLILVGCWIDSNAFVLRGVLRARGHILLDSALAAAIRTSLFLTMGLLFVNESLTLERFAITFVVLAIADAFLATSLIKYKLSLSLCQHWDVPGAISLIKRGAPFTVLAVLGMLYIRASLIILGWGKTDLALENAAGFSLAGRIPDGLSFIPLSLMGAAIPYLSRKAEDKEAILPVFRNLELLLGGLGVMVAGGMIAFPHVLIPLVSTKAYLKFSLVFQLYALTVLLTFLQYVYSNLLICYDKEHLVAKRYAGILLVNIVLNLALDWKLGALGAVISLLICEMCAVMVDLQYLKKLSLTTPPQVLMSFIALAAISGSTAWACTFVEGVKGLLLYGFIAGIGALLLFFYTQHRKA